MSKKLFFSLVITALLAAGNVFAQQGRVMNLPKYDQKLYHFGFSLGLNNYDFAIRQVSNFRQIDSIYVLETTAQNGFNIAIVSNLRITDNLDLRFIPGLAFAGRTIDYTLISKNNKTTVVSKPIESTLMEFPLSIKYKSARYNNFRAYLLGGAKYSLDMASQAGKKNEDEILVKLRKHDLAYEIGFGLDFYLQYFKFSPEIKFSMGLNDLLQRDNNVYTTPIDKLNSKSFLISFLFE